MAYPLLGNKLVNMSKTILDDRWCFLWGQCKVIIKKCSAAQSSRQNRGSQVISEGSSFEKPGGWDMSLGEEELNGVESSELAVTE
jgi:hypothetical protein